MKEVKRLKPAEVIKDFQQNVNPNMLILIWTESAKSAEIWVR